MLQNDVTLFDVESETCTKVLKDGLVRFQSPGNKCKASRPNVVVILAVNETESNHFLLEYRRGANVVSKI